MAQSHKGTPAPAWYALQPGGWRDYVTLLHPPYTAWHLAYVVIGGCLAPVVRWERLGVVVVAFALAMGIGAHALDELQGRPLQTRIPDGVLKVLAAASVAAACGIGTAGALAWEAWLAVFVPIGVFLVVVYNLELFGGLFHTPLWFGLAWGGFPTLTGYAVVAGRLEPAAFVAAAFAVVVTLVQHALSTPVRRVRRKVVSVTGEVRLRDGTIEPIDAGTLLSPAERGLRLLTLATVLLAAALVVSRI